MILVLSSLVDETTFYIQLVACIGFLVLVLNIWAFVQYCSNAGSPYKSIKHEQKAIWVGRVAFVWSVATICKLVAAWYDPAIFNFESSYEGDNLKEGCILFSIIALTEMFPVAVILEGKFIRIFTLSHLDLTQEQNSIVEEHRTSSKYDSEEIRDQVIDDESGLRLLSPAAEDRL